MIVLLAGFAAASGSSDTVDEPLPPPPKLEMMDVDGAWRKLHEYEVDKREDIVETATGLVLIGTKADRLAFKQLLAESLSADILRMVFLEIEMLHRPVRLYLVRSPVRGAWPIKVGLTFDAFERAWLPDSSRASAPARPVKEKGVQTIDLDDIEALPERPAKPWGSDRAQHLLHVLVEASAGVQALGTHGKRYRHAHRTALEAENAYREAQGKPALVDVEVERPLDTGRWIFHYEDGSSETWKWRAGHIKRIDYAAPGEPPK